MKIFIYTISMFLLTSSMAHAAMVSVSAPEVTTEGQSFSVFINLDTDGTPINSFDINLSYPVDVVSFSGYKEEGTIKSLWLTSPTDKNGEVHFSGIIPGGVDGVYDPNKNELQPIPILQLLFFAKDEGQGTFIVKESNILKNDGKGTPLTHTRSDFKIQVSKSLDTSYDKNSSNNELTDIISPLPFVVEFIEAGLFSRTPSMIIFYTTDTESGVRSYQLRVAGNNWKDISSPMPVSKGLIKRDLTIRAVDFNGNTRESNIEIPGIFSNIQLLGIVLIGGICYFVLFVLKRKR